MVETIFFKGLRFSLRLPTVLFFGLFMLFTAFYSSAHAQNFSGRGIDMRALQGQAAQCRGPALNLLQRSYVLRQSIADILSCNAEGGLFQSDGTCVPAVSPAHLFDERSGTNDPQDRSRLAFEEDDAFSIFGIIGGLDGLDITCAPVCVPGSPIWPECVEGPPTDCQPDHSDPDCCDIYPDQPICDEDTCTEQTDTRDIPCPDGQVGTISEERFYSCPDGEWSEWEEVSNNCSDECIEETRSDTENCPEGQAGFIQTAEEFICPEAEWRDLPDENFCCAGERTLACPSGYMGDGIVQRRDTCDGSWYEYARDCVGACTIAGKTWRVLSTQKFSLPGDPYGVVQRCDPADISDATYFCCEPGIAVCRGAGDPNGADGVFEECP